VQGLVVPGFRSSPSVALTAAIATTLALYVPECEYRPSAIHRMTGRVPAMAATGKPPPRAFAKVEMSGCTP